MFTIRIIAFVKIFESPHFVKNGGNVLRHIARIPAVKTNVTSEGLALKASFNAAIWAALLIALLFQQTDTEVIG